MKEGWEIKKFEELIQENQIGLIKSTKEQGNDKAFRYLKMDSITSDNSLVHNKYVYVDATRDELKKFTLNDGDFLFNTRNSYELVGKTCVFSSIDDSPTLFNNNIMRVVFKKGISSKFINYAFSSEQVKDRLQKLKSGTTSVVGIYYNGLRNIEIPLPPLPEQQRIVSILDEAFAAIAKAKANAEQNLKNAKELFESYLQGVFEKKGESWEEVNLSELFNVKHGFAFQGEYFSQVGEYVLLTPGNFFEEGGYRDRGEKQKYFVGEIPSDFILKKGDLLVAMTEQAAGLLGSPILVPESDKFLHNQRLGLIIPKQNVEIDNEFFFHVFNLKRVRKDIHDSGTGVKVRHTSPTKIGQVEISYPKSIKEQQTIVRQLDALRAETQKLEALYQKKIADLEELKKSILQKAFAGELTGREVVV